MHSMGLQTPGAKNSFSTHFLNLQWNNSGKFWTKVRRNGPKSESSSLKTHFISLILASSVKCRLLLGLSESICEGVWHTVGTQQMFNLDYSLIIKY